MTSCSPTKPAPFSTLLAPARLRSGSTERPARLSWRVVDPRRSCVPGSVAVRWAELAEATDNPFRLHQSPAWFKHLCEAAEGPSPMLAYGFDERGEVRAVVPFTISLRRLPIHVARGYCLRTTPVAMASILGGEPMMPMTREAVDGLIQTLSRFARQEVGLDLRGVAEGSRFVELLAEAGPIGANFLHERFPHLGRIDLIPLPATYGEFLGRHGSKKRYNLKRQARQLADRAGGNLRLVVVEDPDRVPELVRALEAIGSTVEETPERLVDLAERGLLLCYVLEASGRPVAAMMGKRFGGTYLVDRTWHDRGWGACSPGSTLLHLAIEDLIEGRSVDRINLGYGSPKAEFASTNLRPEYACRWLIPATPANRSVWGIRSAMRAGAAGIKALLGVARRAIGSVPGRPDQNQRGLLTTLSSDSPRANRPTFSARVSRWRRATTGA